MEAPRRSAEPHGRSAAAKQPAGHYARGYGRCPSGGVLLLRAEAAVRSDLPGEAGRPIADGRQAGRWKGGDPH